MRPGLILGLLLTVWLAINPSSAVKPVTVGFGQGCHYPPQALNQAIKEHRLIYLTSGIDYPPLVINSPRVHIIGGFSHCYEPLQLPDRSQKSRISGSNRQSAVTIQPPEQSHEPDNLIQLSHLSLTAGHAEHGGGISITGPHRVQLNNLTISHNYASQIGGGIWVSGQSVELNIMDSLIHDNQAMVLGGGIGCEGHHLIVTDSNQLMQHNRAPLATDLLLDEKCFFQVVESD